jgi:nucleotide-binding universal stress UspA family protein
MSGYLSRQALLLEWSEPMFTSILVPVNFTDTDRAAVEVARDLAAASGGSVTLLHVIETIRDVPFEDLAEFYEPLEQKAREGMASLAEPLLAGDLTVEERVVYGKRAQEIMAYAHQHDHDLIVLTARPPGPERMGEIWGTISHQVAILAHCPVLLVK